MRYSARKSKRDNHTREILYILLLGLCTVFSIWYISAASKDVVWSDYIRIINEYLPDVKDVSKLLVPDILTRAPLSYLIRLINTEYFGFSVNFDRAFTIVGLVLTGIVVLHFALKLNVKPHWYILLLIIIFSLGKWEVLLNGTAWPHVVAIGLFFVNYLIFDRIWTGDSTAWIELAALVMPFALLLIAAEYIASYAVTMIIVSLFGAMTGGAVNVGSKRAQKVFLRILISTSAALLLYLLSRHFASWEHAGATDMTLIEVIKWAPSYLPKFFLKTLAGSIIGQETVSKYGISDIVLYILGAGVFAAYVLSFITYIKSGMSEISVFPVILLISGAVNHCLITYARWIFLSEDYALSSRYGVQFMIGLIGIVFIAAMYKKPEMRYSRRKIHRLDNASRILICIMCLVMAFGMCLTTADEINKAKYRKENYEKMEEMVLSYKDHTEEELCSVLEWHKDPAALISALDIIKENKLNVFGNPRR